MILEINNFLEMQIMVGLELLISIGSQHLYQITTKNLDQTLILKINLELVI